MNGSDKKRDVMPDMDDDTAAMVAKYLVTPPKPKSGPRRVFEGRPPIQGRGTFLPERGAMGTSESHSDPPHDYHTANCRMCDGFADKNGLCGKHLAEAKKMRRGEGPRTHEVTDEERAEIQRRHAQFESKIAIARSLGLTTSQVTHVLKAKSS